MGLLDTLEGRPPRRVALREELAPPGSCVDGQRALTTALQGRRGGRHRHEGWQQVTNLALYLMGLLGRLEGRPPRRVALREELAPPGSCVGGQRALTAMF